MTSKMLTKNPKLVLNDIVLSNRLEKPVFHIENDSSPFKCKLTLGKLIAHGVADTKKKAKSAAASNLLPLLPTFKKNDKQSRVRKIKADVLLNDVEKILKSDDNLKLFMALNRFNKIFGIKYGGRSTDSIHSAYILYDRKVFKAFHSSLPIAIWQVTLKLVKYLVGETLKRTTSIFLWLQKFVTEYKLDQSFSITSDIYETATGLGFTKNVLDNTNLRIGNLLFKSEGMRANQCFVILKEVQNILKTDDKLRLLKAALQLIPGIKFVQKMPGMNFRCRKVCVDTIAFYGFGLCDETALNKSAEKAIRYKIKRLLHQLQPNNDFTWLRNIIIDKSDKSGIFDITCQCTTGMCKNVEKELLASIVQLNKSEQVGSNILRNLSHLQSSMATNCLLSNKKCKNNTSNTDTTVTQVASTHIMPIKVQVDDHTCPLNSEPSSAVKHFDEGVIADILANLIVKKCEELNEIEIAGYCVLAGIVKVIDEDFQNGTVISLATGNKCRSGTNIQFSGEVLNDCHAEILARRGLLLYLYDQLKQIITLRDSTYCDFEITKNESTLSYKLKQSVTFHLYISSAPCGDGRLYSINPSPKSQRILDTYGKLRGKIENGHNGVLTENFAVTEQTFGDVKYGNPLIIMSCSDKLLKWNIVGIQGALLSNLISPIYLTRIIIGKFFSEYHCIRALYGRIEKHIEDLENPYSLHRPKISPTSIQPIGIKARSGTSTNWVINNSLEFIKPSNGTLRDGSSSRLCKKNLLAQFKNLLNYSEYGMHEKRKQKSYCDYKNQSVTYQTSKQIFDYACVKANIGHWIHKSKSAYENLY